MSPGGVPWGTDGTAFRFSRSERSSRAPRWSSRIHRHPAAGVTPTIVTIEWHDGNADQIDVLPILQNHGMHATFLVNTGPILAGDPAKLTVGNLNTLFAAGNEIAGHTLDHVNIQPLSTAAARNEVCTDRNNLLSHGSPNSFQPTSLAYPFASFDDASEDVAHYCGYNGASATAGLTLKGPVANTVPPGRPVRGAHRAGDQEVDEARDDGAVRPGRPSRQAQTDGSALDGLRVPPSLRRTCALRALRDLRVEVLRCSWTSWTRRPRTASWSRRCSR